MPMLWKGPQFRVGHYFSGVLTMSNRNNAVLLTVDHDDRTGHSVDIKT